MQIASYLVSRAGEASSWAGIAAVMAGLGVQLDPGLWQNLVAVVVPVAAMMPVPLEPAATEAPAHSGLSLPRLAVPEAGGRTTSRQAELAGRVRDTISAPMAPARGTFMSVQRVAVVFLESATEGMAVAAMAPLALAEEAQVA